MTDMFIPKYGNGQYNTNFISSDWATYTNKGITLQDLNGVLNSSQMLGGDKTFLGQVDIDTHLNDTGNLTVGDSVDDAMVVNATSTFTGPMKCDIITANAFNGNATSASTVATLTDNTNGTFYIPFCKTTAPTTTNQALYLDDSVGPLTYNPSTSTLKTNNLTSSSGIISIYGYNTNFPTERAIYLRQSTTAGSTTSSNIISAWDFNGSNIYCNISLNNKSIQAVDTITANSFNGNATSASTVVTLTDNTDGEYYLPFCKSTAPTSTKQALYLDDTVGPLTYNPSTSTLKTNNLTSSSGLISIFGYNTNFPTDRAICLRQSTTLGSTTSSSLIAGFDITGTVLYCNISLNGKNIQAVNDITANAFKGGLNQTTETISNTAYTVTGTQSYSNASTNFFKHLLINPTSSGASIVLPVATTLTNSWVVFINTSTTYNVSVYQSDGTTLITSISVATTIYGGGPGSSVKFISSGTAWYASV